MGGLFSKGGAALCSANGWRGGRFTSREAPPPPSQPRLLLPPHRFQLWGRKGGRQAKPGPFQRDGAIATSPPPTHRSGPPPTLFSSLQKRGRLGGAERGKAAPGRRGRGPPPCKRPLPVAFQQIGTGGSFCSRRGAGFSHPPQSPWAWPGVPSVRPGEGDAPGGDSLRGAAGKRRSPSPWRGSPPAASPGTGSGVWGGRGEGEPRPARLGGDLPPLRRLRLYSQLLRLRGARRLPGIVVPVPS